MEKNARVLRSTGSPGLPLGVTGPVFRGTGGRAQTPPASVRRNAGTPEYARSPSVTPAGAAGWSPLPRNSGTPEYQPRRARRAVFGPPEHSGIVCPGVPEKRAAAGRMGRGVPVLRGTGYVKPGQLSAGGREGGTDVSQGPAASRLGGPLSRRERWGWSTVRVPVARGPGCRSRVPEIPVFADVARRVERGCSGTPEDNAAAGPSLGACSGAPECRGCRPGVPTGGRSRRG